jgi:hypothetical protein
MLLLSLTTDKLQVVTTGTADLHTHVSFVDKDGSSPPAITPDKENHQIVSATTTDICAAPAASKQRAIQTMSFRNKHATASQGVKVQFNENTTISELFNATLLAGEELVYEKGKGWAVFDANGAQKLAMSGSGRWLKTTILTAGTSFTTQMATATIGLRMVGGGGGGGSVAAAVSLSGGGGGGGAGGYLEKTVAVSPNTAYAYTIGAAGTAATAGANNGGVGGDSTFVVGATTYTAKGGSGGIGGTAANPSANLGGAGGTVSTNGDVNSGGMPGQAGASYAAALAVSGNGGSGQFGSGGNGVKTTVAGAAGLGNGSGGSGSCSISNGTAAAGGAGTAGLIAVDEYA